MRTAATIQENNLPLPSRGRGSGRGENHLRILTWNVLHRVHAENHGEPAVTRWPDETERQRGLIALLAQCLEQDTAALLQEVSGDLLAAITARFPEHAVLNHQFPRVPRQKGARTLAAPQEHLVVLAPQGSHVLRAHTFASDPGKGFLSVKLPSGLTALCTHVSWGTKGAAQLELLAQVFRGADGPVVLGGDFNAGREVLAPFDAEVGIPPPKALKTRAGEGGGADIDHLLCRAAVLTDVLVLDHQELSDHRPVAATLTW